MESKQSPDPDVWNSMGEMKESSTVPVSLSAFTPDKQLNTQLNTHLVTTPMQLGGRGQALYQLQAQSSAYTMTLI
jgi:hypothetical protein